MIVSLPVKATVFLYVRILTAGHGGEDSRTAFANWESCRAALASAKIVTASGGDAENVVVMWCGGSRDAKIGIGQWVREK